MSTPRVSIVIPTWNGEQLLDGALRSLRAQTYRDFETVVVDNGSTDGTVALLEQHHPEVRLIRFEMNRGFAVAANTGIQAARGDVVVMMNNDVVADAGWLEALVSALDTSTQVGSCASRMLSHADPRIIDSAGDELGLFAWSRGHGEADGAAFSGRRDVFSACAGAAAFRKEALDDVGLFDERFIAYLEDVDLGARLQLAGWRCLYVPDAVVYHHGSATGRRIPDTRLFLILRNSLFLFFQYMPLRSLLLWTPLMIVWPFSRVVRERRPLRLAVKALVSFAGSARQVLARRREVRHRRRISVHEFTSRLSPRLQRRKLSPKPDSASWRTSTS